MVPSISKEESWYNNGKEAEKEKGHVEGVGEGDVEEVVEADVEDLRPDAKAMAKAQI